MPTDGEITGTALEDRPESEIEKGDDQHDDARRRDRILWRRPSTAGLITAFVFVGFSLTPSLTPRMPPYQAIVSGLSVTSGYAVGATLGWALRRFGLGITWRPTKTVRLAVVGGAVAGMVAIMVLGAAWQNDLRDIMGMPHAGPAYGMVVPISVAMGAILLFVARLVRWAAIRFGELIDRWLPTRVATTIAAVTVGALTYFLLTGILVASLMDGMRATASLTDQGTPPGIEPPTAGQRSGSAASPIPWDTLGRQGRVFVAGGRSVDDLAAFSAMRNADVEAMEPIRVYAGMRSVEDGSLDDVAALVVDELHRTGAWDRQVLVVVTTTGTGWVDPGLPDAIELMYAGDTAIAAMQYSFLPSWISFIADRSTPPAAGRALFEAVFEAWSALPDDDRPLLLVAGVSLGAYGGQGAFSGLQDLLIRTDGALWVGTPGFTTMWRELTEDRDPGSPQRSPVYRGGEHVRWGTGVDTAANVWDLDTPWLHPRVVYVQHASDGVVWWSSDLWYRRPDWIREPPGPDVLPYLWWTPLATFWQVTMDMFIAAEVPPGHGHNYLRAYADAWAAVAPPEGWTHDDTALLREEVARGAQRE